MDKTLVEAVRAQLASASLAQRAFARLKLFGPGTAVPDFQVHHAAGPSGPLVLARRSGAPLTKPIPAMFTIAGYDKTFRAQAPAMVKQLADEEAWVLGPKYANQGANRAVTALAEVQRLYLAEYIKVWDELLRDLMLIPPADLQAQHPLDHAAVGTGLAAEDTAVSDCPRNQAGDRPRTDRSRRRHRRRSTKSPHR